MNIFNIFRRISYKGYETPLSKEGLRIWYLDTTKVPCLTTLMKFEDDKDV